MCRHIHRIYTHNIYTFICHMSVDIHVYSQVENKGLFWVIQSYLQFSPHPTFCDICLEAIDCQRNVLGKEYTMETHK